MRINKSRIQYTILKNLLYNEEYSRKVIPYLYTDYFEQKEDLVLFEEITKFIIKYNSNITKEALLIEAVNRRDLTEDQIKIIKEMVNSFNDDESVDLKWLIDITEKWCKDRAIYNALTESLEIADGNDPKKTREAIPSILSDALSVSFNNNIGHDYFENFEERYEFYHKVEDRIPFDIELLNVITKNGLPKKTLNIFLGGTGAGKTLVMCHLASAAISSGKNVLYITLEMAEERIAERIDANLLNVTLDTLGKISKSIFTSKLSHLAKKTTGKLIIKEYPTATAHSGHFKSLLSELSLKKSFTPDLIIIDYLNICASSRYKANNTINSYSYVKAIAEELRGLAVEYDVPVVSATQTTRSGYGSSDPDLTDTSESFGLPATADFMIALITSDELEEMGQIMFKQLKNRYGPADYKKRFTVGIDRSKMRLFDCEQKAQAGIIDAGKDYDVEDDVTTSKNTRKIFDNFKFN